MHLFKTWVRVWKFECVIVCPIFKVCILEFEYVLKVSMPFCLSNEFVWRFVLQMFMSLSVQYEGMNVSVWVWRFVYMFAILVHVFKCLNVWNLKLCLYVCHFCVLEIWGLFICLPFVCLKFEGLYVVFVFVLECLLVWRYVFVLNI